MSISRADSWCRVSLEGELDLATAPCLVLELERAEQRRPRLLLIDLRDLAFADLTGMRVLIAAQERAHDRGGEFVVLDPRPIVRRLLSLVAVCDRLNVIDDRAATGRFRTQPDRAERW